METHCYNIDSKFRNTSGIFYSEIFKNVVITAVSTVK